MNNLELFKWALDSINFENDCVSRGEDDVISYLKYNTYIVYIMSLVNSLFVEQLDDVLKKKKLFDAHSIFTD